MEKTVNWLLVANEAGDETKWKFIFAPAPANAPFCQLPVQPPFNQRSRYLLELRGMAYGVNGTIVFSIDHNGQWTNIGSVQDDGNPVCMVANGNGQIFIASAGLGYVIPAGGGANSLIAINTDQFLGSSFATMQDNYIIVVSTQPGTGTTVTNVAQFQVSGNDTTPAGDCTLWDATNYQPLQGQADRLVACISRREYLLLLGSRRSQVFVNQGSGSPPFASYNETFIETGCGAKCSVCDLGDSIMWIGEDERGQRAAWRAFNFQPQRVSNFAIEQQWQSYPRVDDAVAFTHIWRGHLLYQITFPSAVDSEGRPWPRTWQYDATTSQLIGRACWQERQFLNATNQLVGRPEVSHCFAYGRHLVGSNGADGNPGAVYQYSDRIYTDCGTDYSGLQSQRAMVRDRIAVHLWQENVRIFYHRIEFELERGIGLDGVGLGTNPVIMLRWSNDGGNTWSQEFQCPVGQIGQYRMRVFLNRLGYARDRIFWVRCSDPVAWSLLTAELDLTPGTS